MAKNPRDRQDGLTLRDLAAAAGVPIRTVRYYLENHVLQSPGKGPGVRYPASDTVRIRLIRRWQAEGLILSEIKEKLATTDPADLVRMLESTPAPVPAPAPNTWEHFEVADGLQVLVRRPASLAINRSLARVLDELRKIVAQSE